MRVLDLDHAPTTEQIDRLSIYLARLHGGGAPERYSVMARALLAKCPGLGDIVMHADFFDPYFNGHI